MSPARILSFVNLVFVLLLAGVEAGMHESARKDWLVILLGVVVLGMVVAIIVQRRREVRDRPSSRTH